MRALVLLLLSLAVVGAVAAPPEPCPDPADPVLRWNDAVLTSIKVEKTPPPVAARNLALVHVAVYDSVALATGEYRPLRTALEAPVGADPLAASASAAHRVLVDLYPRRAAEFDAVLEDTLGHVPEGRARTRGTELGRAVSEQLLRWRSGDAKVSIHHTYKPGEGAGRWRATPPGYAEPLLPGWAKVPNFVVADAARFRPPGPPALDSQAYATSLKLVRAIGSVTSTERTKDQTEIARFWADGDGTVTPPGHWNRIARGLAVEKKLKLMESARLFGMLNVALADASVVCWDCKYRFDFWRPVTALRELDKEWMPLLPTPPFPAYTSGHSSFSGAAATALASFFGTDRVRFSSTSDGLPGVTRSYESFSSAAEEAGMSRIYGGIHWTFDNTDGLACGREVAKHITQRHFIAAGARGATPMELPERTRER
jgi:hypothetical protein